MLASSSVQEAHDLALVAHVASLRSRVPFVHFFDGFRTSHEIDRIVLLSADDLRSLVGDDDVLALRSRAMTPDAPVLRGTSQNPDAYFQGREAGNPFYVAAPAAVRAVMNDVAGLTGRRYDLVDYHGAPDAERVVVLMGSGVGAALEAVETMCAAGEPVGLLQIRLYRPFPAEQLLAALPATLGSIAVLDRTKEPGAPAEPLYLDVLTSLQEGVEEGRAPFLRLPQVVGGRFGLSSKEFTPAMVKAVFDELGRERPKRRFTVGIDDDVTQLSIPVPADFAYHRPKGELQAVFFGLGSDGTVGANKRSVKIIGESTALWAQGYFVYDSKKAGSVTVSHLRFGPRPIRSTYLVSEADFIGCHQFGILERMDVLAYARLGAVFLLNSPYPASEVWDRLPHEVQQQVIDRRLEFWVIDAYAIATEVGLGGRINTVMQPCFFALSGVLPAEEAIDHVKQAVEKTYGRRGPTIVEKNFAAIDRALAALERVSVPGAATASQKRRSTIPDDAPDFVRRVTAPLLAGEGDSLPVGAFPADGTYPLGTSVYEKRSIARQIPIWDPQVCIQCGKCACVCPHATIRLKVYRPEALQGAPVGFRSEELRDRAAFGHRLTVQVAPDDCTGCGVCVDVCPAKSKSEVRHKAINMEPADEQRETERANWRFFTAIPPAPRDLLPHDSVRGSQVLEPLFQFSGACAGCGETPYIKLISQLFGDRIVVANATGCSSIYGGNLPTTPWATDRAGRGPAWNNSLFEDAAEFGLGLRLGYEMQGRLARRLLDSLAPHLDDEAVAAILAAPQLDEAGVVAQRARLARLLDRLRTLADATDGGEATRQAAAVSRHVIAVAGALVRQGTWIIGGDGWAYDIGFGGLDHVLHSGRDVNLLVLDTEVYSNTGGQSSKATPRGAVAKFASRGKPNAKKDLGAIARAYGDVYVAQISLGGNDLQAVRALLEADAWPGPSLVIAYSTCIAQGIDMSKSMSHQKDAVHSGYWPLYRFRPSPDPEGQPFTLDSKPPSIPLAAFASTEARYAALQRSHPADFERLMGLAQEDIDERWRYYEQLVAIERSLPLEPEIESDAGYRYDEKEH
jgi:pyruvate-ferredoxin/flavodoxin oxidoreductase